MSEAVMSLPADSALPDLPEKKIRGMPCPEALSVRQEKASAPSVSANGMGKPEPVRRY